MPREKVPYPCECGECGTSQKLKTINGAGPNSEGNISILGGEGVAVKTDTESHTVTLDVDTDSIVSVKHAENADTAAEAVHAGTADTADEAVHASTADDATYAKYDTAGKTIMNTDGAQTVTGAKTFAGENTITGKTGISGAVNVTGAVNASNTQNVIKVASHDSVLTSEDVLNAADIMTANGSANNLVHRTAVNILSASGGSFIVQSRLLYAPKISTASSVSATPWKELVRIDGWGNNANLELEIFGSINGPRSLNHGKWWFCGSTNANYQGCVLFAATTGSDIDTDFLAGRINADGTMSIFANMSKAWMSYRYSILSSIRDGFSMTYSMRSNLKDLKDTDDLSSEGTIFSKIEMQVIN